MAPRRFDHRFEQHARRRYIAARQRDIGETRDRVGNREAAAGSAGSGDERIEAGGGEGAVTDCRARIERPGFGKASCRRVSDDPAQVRGKIERGLRGCEFSAMGCEVADRSVVPGEKELAPELLGDASQFFERLRRACPVVLDVIRDRHHLPAVGDGPLIIDRPTELDAARQTDASGDGVEERLPEAERVQRARRRPIVADRLGHRQRLRSPHQHGLEVVSVAEHAGEPASALAEVTAQFPEQRQRRRESQHLVRRARGVTPFQRGVEVVVIGLEPGEVHRPVRHDEPRRRLLGETEEIREVPLANGVGVARLDEPRLEELAHRFEHPVAGVRAFMVDMNQRLVDEPPERVEHREPVALVVGADGLGCVQREPVQDREPPRECTLLVVE